MQSLFRNYRVNVTEEEHRQVKSKTAQKGLSMSYLIAELLRGYLKGKYDIAD